MIAPELRLHVLPQRLIGALTEFVAQIPICVWPLHKLLLLAARRSTCVVMEHVLELVLLLHPFVRQFHLLRLTHVQMECAQISQHTAIKAMGAHTTPHSVARTREFVPAPLLLVLRLFAPPTLGSLLDSALLINSKVNYSRIDVQLAPHIRALMERAFKLTQSARRPLGILQQELRLPTRAPFLPLSDARTDSVQSLLTCVRRSPATTAMGAQLEKLLVRAVHV